MEAGRIVKASVKDSAIIADIISTSNKDVAIRFGLNKINCPKHPSFCTKDWILDEFSRNVQYFLIMNNEKAVGCMSFETADKHLAYLNRLAVLPEYRHHGFGRELVRYFFLYALAFDITKVSIGIIANHSELKDWYHKLGFVESNTKKFPHLPFDVTYMICDI